MFSGGSKTCDFGYIKIQVQRIGHGQYHSHLHEHLGLFSSETDEAIILSTDGAQLVAQRESDCWPVILTFLNVPTELRSRKINLFICSVIPGPKSPGDLESFDIRYIES